MAGNPFDQFDTPTPQGGGLRIGTPDPRRVNDEARAQSAEARAQEASARQQAEAERQAALFQWQLVKAQADAAKAQRELSTGAPMSATERAQAVTAYYAAQRLDGLIAQIEKANAEGPGATSGIAGVTDFLPTEANQRFDKAANAVRGDAIKALGFTSGQTNTASEALLNIGPYIPNSWNWDATNLDQIQRLKDLAASARQRSVAMLGGYPDNLGRIYPTQQDADKASGVTPPLVGNAASPDRAQVPPPVVGGNQPPPGGGGGGVDKSSVFVANDSDPYESRLATGSTRLEADNEINGLITTFARNRRSFSDLNAYLKAHGKLEVPSTEVGAYANWVKYFQSPEGKGFRGSAAAAQKRVPVTLLEQISASPVGAAVTGVAKGATAGLAPYARAGVASAMTGSNFWDELNVANANDAAVRNAGPVNGWAGFGGELAGGAATGGLTANALGKVAAFASRPMAANIGADLAYGGTYGAASNPDNPLAGAALGMAVAPAGTLVGQTATRLGGAALSGVTAPAAKRLAELGVPLTGGQIMRDRGGLAGRVVSGAEDASTSLPIMGDLIQARRNDSLRAANQVAFDRAGQPIGAQGVGIGREGLDALNGAKGDAYTDSLGQMNLQIDPAFEQGFGQAVQAGQRLPEHLQPNFNTTIDRLGDYVSPEGQIPGTAMQAMKRTLRGEIAANRGQPGGQFVNNALGQADSSLMSLAQRQAPEAFAAYQNADRTHGMSKALEKAVGAASGRPGDPGVFSGAQLANALKGPKVTAGTRDALAPLAEDMVRVLPSQLGDSGTPRRLMLQGMTSGLGVGAGTLAPSAIGPGIGIGAIGALLNTKLGQKAVQAALIGNRGATATAIGKMLKAQTPKAGLLGRQAFLSQMSN